jgi:hypothetical protein
MPKPTPDEVLKAIEEPDPEEEMERVLAMTPEQRREELEAAGVDMNELHAKADAWHERFVQAAAEAEKKAAQGATAEPARTRSLPPKPQRRSFVSLAAAASVVAVAGGVVYTVALRPPEPVASPDQRTAADLRKRAFDACSREQWKECLAGLDEAKRLDPAGDEAAAVQAARRRAGQAGTDTPR